MFDKPTRRVAAPKSPRRYTSRQAPLAARQAARRRFRQPVGNLPQRAQTKFREEGQRPSTPDPEGETPQMIPKRSGRAAPASHWDAGAKGNPLRTQSCNPLPLAEPRASERSKYASPPVRLHICATKNPPTKVSGFQWLPLLDSNQRHFG